VLLVLVPDGDRTWFGVSTDEKIISTKLAGALKKQNTLENRKDLRVLKSGKSINGGFMTLMAVLSSYLQSASMMMGPGTASRAQAAMPHKGASAMVFTSAVDAGPTLSWKMSIPSGVFEDIGGAAMTMKGAIGASPPPVVAPAPPPPPPAPVPRKRP
jgi:hypothetical protein